MPTTQPPIQDLTTYLIDLDGVVYRGETIIAGAKEFVQWLRDQQKKYLFLTNNSFASESQVIEKIGTRGDRYRRHSCDGSRAGGSPKD